MSSIITYLINLHKEEKINDSALNKALNALQQPTSTKNDPDVQKELSLPDSIIAEKVRTRRRKKNKMKKQKKETC